MDVRRKAISLFTAIAVMLLFTGGRAAAQLDTQPKTVDKLFSTQENPQMRRPMDVLGIGQIDIPLRTPEEAVFALDQAIDPETYVLGPGDVIGVNLRGGVGLFYQTMIAPDGQLMVPRMPMVQLGGLTLAEAREKVVDAWGGDSRTSIDITVLQMRHMRVSIGGAVLNPGEYVVTPADRATTLVQLAGGLVKEKSSVRRAWLVREDGERVKVDLLRYVRSGALDANPRLSAGANLVIEPMRLEGPHVQIGGGVVIPGTYEYVKGDRVMDLVEVGGGLRLEAIPDSSVLTHFTESGEPQGEPIDVKAMMEAGERGPELKPGDLVYIRMTSDQPERAAVTVQGEVRYPGVYPIEAGKTTLQDVIARAGGFTDKAYLRGGRIWKERPFYDFRNIEAERIDTLQNDERDDIDLEFFKYYFRSQQKDYMPVNMETLYRGDKDERAGQDVVLFDSLVVNIPREPLTVLVAGQVKQPGYYPYKEGYDFNDYIDLAGGYASGAQKRYARLVQYESSAWTRPSGGSEVDPGAMIFVPAKQVGTDWETFRDAASVLIQFGTLFLLAYRTLYN